MASIIRIKRSSTNGNPSTLGAGELAYSALAGTISNGGDRLYIGMGTETAGNAANHVVIGGKYFTDMMDHATGTLTADSAVLVDSNKKIDEWNVDNLTLNGNTLSSTDTNGNILLDPAGTGYVQLVGTNGVVIPVGTTAQRGPAIQGTVRYNTDTSSFEGYSGTVWGSLGGVKSVDGLTYITAESSPGSSDDTLHFYAASGASTSVEVGTWNQNTLTLLAGTDSTSTTTGALVVAGGVGIGENLYVGGSLNVTGAVVYTGGATFNSNLTLVGSDTAGEEFFRVQNGSGVTKFQVDSANGNTTISGTLGVTGATSLSSSLDVTGNLNVNTNKFNVVASSGNTSIAGTLGVTGATTLSSTLGVTGATTLSSTLGVTGATTLSSTLDVTGNLAVNSNKFVVTAASGNTSIGGTLGVTGNTTLSGTLGVTGATTLSSTLGVAGDFAINTNKFTVVAASGNTAIAGTLGVTGATTLSSTLGVTGATTLSSTLGVTGNTTIGGTLGVTGATTLSSTANVVGDFSVNTNKFNVVASSGNTSIAGTLGVTGATTLSSTLGVTGNTTVGGTLGVTGATTLSSTLGVTGAATLSSTLAVTGNSTFTGSVIANGGVTASGAVNVTAGSGNNSINLTPTGTGTVDVANKRITSVAEPTQASDAATKNYVDAVKTGLDPKDSVRVATTANLNAAYNNGTSGLGATLTNAGTQAALTIDSIVLSVGDRVLVKDQTAGLQNGIYVVTTVGSASTNWVLTRSTDADNNPSGELTAGAFTFVEEGTVNEDNGFVCTTNGTVTIGTTAITWVQFSGAGQVIAGDGLTKTGNTLNVVGTANRISISADAVDIASTYVGQTSITTLGTIGTGTWQGTIISPTYGGTGVNNGTKTITLGGNLTTSGAFNTTLTATANTNVTLPTTGTLATLAGNEALTNKTVNGLTISTTTGTLSLANGSTFATSGAFGVTLTATGTTALTLPTTGTLATLAGAETLSNKTITSSSFSGTTVTTTGNVSVGGTLGVTGAANLSSTLGVTGATTLSSTLGVTGNVTLQANLTGAGAATSTLDGFNIDGGTY